MVASAGVFGLEHSLRHGHDPGCPHRRHTLAPRPDRAVHCAMLRMKAEPLAASAAAGSQLQGVAFAQQRPSERDRLGEAGDRCGRRRAARVC